MLLEIIRAQRELAKILFLMNVNQNSREAAATLHTDLDRLVKRFDK